MTNLIKFKKTFLFLTVIIAISLLFPVFTNAISDETGGLQGALEQKFEGSGGFEIPTIEFLPDPTSAPTTEELIGTDFSSPWPTSGGGSFPVSSESDPSFEESQIDLRSSESSRSKTGGVLTGASDSRVITIANPLGVNTFAELIANINQWLLYIAVPIFTLMIFIGAFQLMASGGVPDKITQGRHTITWAVIGYALLILSTGIVSIIKEIFGAS